MKFLGRVIGRSSAGYYWESGGIHRDILLEEWGLVDCKGVCAPIVVNEDENEQAQPEMDSEAARRALARRKCLSQNRPDIATASGVLARSMARPRVGDEVRLKRVLRYLRARAARV